jgi:hypothetical protein
MAKTQQQETLARIRQKKITETWKKNYLNMRGGTSWLKKRREEEWS